MRLNSTAPRLIDGDRTRVAHYLAHFFEHWAGDTRIRADELAVVVGAYARPGAFSSRIAWYCARAARRSRSELPAPVELPTIALWGDCDPMRPLEHREGFERAFPRSTSRVLPGVGHFVPAEAPDAVAAAVAEMLDATPG